MADPNAKGHTFDGVYQGSYFITHTVSGESAAEFAVHRSSSFGYLEAPNGQYAVGTGKRRISMALTDNALKVVDLVTREVMQTLGFELILEVTRFQDCVVYISRTLDQRLAVKVAHVVKVSGSTRLVSALSKKILGKVPAECTMVSKETPDVSVAEASYLGFIKVAKPRGSVIVQGAIKENFRKRAELNQRREERHLPKSGRLMGMSKSDESGTHVSEYPIVVIMSQRSMRIIDIVTGETVSKFHMTQITFQGPVVYKTKPDVYGMITQNAKNMQSNCHLFFLNTGEGKRFHSQLQAALKASTVKIEKTIFSALEGYQREKAPEDLFRKQIRRGHLVPDKCLGAGEYGEVYLANQSNVLENRASTKVISKKRAVKLLKAGANKGAKDEFIRECQMLMCCEGAGIVRMVGVAVQQAPWLCVLEYMPFGDLRSFLKEADEKNILLTSGESIHFCLQLARGCEYIAKARVIHMDLAARNVLLGNRNEVKIADFGMSRLLEKGKGVIEFTTPIRVAIKWTAMEAMMENTFGFASDCWSLGIVFWEICTMGQMPYAHVSNMDMLYFLIGGDRVVQPLDCPDDFWAIMYKCWAKEPLDRWKFIDLVTALVALKQKYPVESPRDIGTFVKKSKGEKKAPSIKARLPNPSKDSDEPKYVYDVPLPNEDGYDIPVEGIQDTNNKANGDGGDDDDVDAYDIPLQDSPVKGRLPSLRGMSDGVFEGDDTKSLDSLSSAKTLDEVMEENEPVDDNDTEDEAPPSKNEDTVEVEVVDSNAVGTSIEDTSIEDTIKDTLTPPPRQETRPIPEPAEHFDNGFGDDVDESLPELTPATDSTNGFGDDVDESLPELTPATDSTTTPTTTTTTTTTTTPTTTTTDFPVKVDSGDEDFGFGGSPSVSPQNSLRENTAAPIPDTTTTTNNNNNNNNTNNNNNNDDDDDADNEGDNEDAGGKLQRSGSVYSGFDADDDRKKSKKKKKKKRNTKTAASDLDRDAIESDFLGSLRRAPPKPKHTESRAAEEEDGC